MAPLAIAKEKEFFEDEGLFVSIEAQSNCKNVLDRVVDGQLAGQPIAIGVGFDRQADLATSFSMDLNGNGITTVSNDVWRKEKRTALLITNDYSRCRRSYIFNRPCRDDD